MFTLKYQRSTMLSQRASRMFAAVVLVIAVIGSAQSAVLRDNSKMRTRLPQEEDSANEVNSTPVLCLRNILGRGDCVDKLTAATRGDHNEKCKPDQFLIEGKCYRDYYDFIVFGSETSEEEKTVKPEEKLPTICLRGFGDKCENKFGSDDAKENKGSAALKCPPNSTIVGGLCSKTNSSTSKDYSENDEISKILPEILKTVESRQSGGQTPEICLRGSELIDGKCVDLFSRESGTEFTEVPSAKDTPPRNNISEEEALPVICSRNSELIDGKCEDHFEPEELKMGCPLNYIKIGDKCIRQDFDQDTIVFPPELCADDSTWNGVSCDKLKKLLKNVKHIQT